MRKFLVLALTLVFVVTLVGCDPNDKTDTAEPQTDNANTAIDTHTTDEPAEGATCNADHGDEAEESLDDDSDLNEFAPSPGGSASTRADTDDK